MITDFEQQKYFKKILYPIEKKWKLNLQFETQKNPIGGIAEAFVIGKNFLAGAEKVCLILGDNFIYGRGFPGDLRMILNNKTNNFRLIKLMFAHFESLAEKKHNAGIALMLIP